MTAFGSILPFMLCVSIIGAAQEVKFIDLSFVQQRTALRHPPSHPPRTCKEEGQCGVGGGFGGVSVGDGAPDRRDPHALGVSLDKISTRDITLDAFEAEFSIVNTGLAPIDVPIFPHLSDLQPPDERQPFRYLSIELVIDLHGVVGSEPATGFGYVELYGARDHEGTVVTLKPGEWVRVKAKVKLHTWPSKAVSATLTGRFVLRTNVFRPADGGGSTQITNLYPNSTTFPAITIQFAPTHSQGERVSGAESGKSE